ncbi:MAG: UDP-N-acetylmuramate dehydrogenase [Mariprofundales bacterium]
MSNLNNLNLELWQKQLGKIGELRCHVEMAERTTLGVGGAARWLFIPHNIQSLCSAMAYIPDTVAIIIVGNGSNILIPDIGIDGLVLDISKLDNIQTKQCDTQYNIEAQAGVRMSKLAVFCANNSLSGLEFMATIPGQLGGGIAMNAGAFSQQIADTLLWIDIIDRRGKLQRLDKYTLHLSYRYCRLAAGAIIVAASFALTANKTRVIKQKMRAMRQQRGNNQPAGTRSCGSVFKNPDNDHAGRLIEAVGLKGVFIGKAQISAQHANFIINTGGAKASDILALIKLAQQRVKQEFGILLEPEVRVFNN